MAAGARNYLYGDGYAYPYSLPLAVIERLAKRLNEVYVFDWKDWISRFIAEPGYNDAEDYGVIITGLDHSTPAYQVLGVHHLTPDENRGLHHVFIDVLDEHNQRIPNSIIRWTWADRTQPGLPDPIRLDKPFHEIGSIEFFGTIINIWHEQGQGVAGLSANHPDELGPNGEAWNSFGHHSFLVVFRRVPPGGPPPSEPPQPAPPPPPPEPPLPTNAVKMIGVMQVTINQAMVAEMRADGDGNVTIMVEVRG
jgi:hypothetical protein